MSSNLLWKILLQEVVIPAAIDAMTNNGLPEETVTSIAEDPGKAVTGIINNPESKEKMRGGLAEVFDGIIKGILGIFGR